MDNDSHEPFTNPLWDPPATLDGEDSPGASGASGARFDGWTPFARKLFLSVLADTGRVSLACEYSQRSRQAAYTLRARDPLFAAGWDAACELARAPLADALYERALDGVTETISRDGQVIAERHRHDNRLSIAVLHRLDRRCERAEEQGSRHLAIAQRWNDWLDLVGKGQESAVTALLESVASQNARHCQHRQLPLGESPTVPRPTTLRQWAALHPLVGSDDGEEPGDDDADLSHRCWKDSDGIWMTDFPPPPGFDGMIVGTWGDSGFERACTVDEALLLDANEEALNRSDRDDDEAARDSWFDCLRADLADNEDTAS